MYDKANAPIVCVCRDQIIQPSYSQERMWHLEHVDYGKHIFNMPLIKRICGPLNVEVLEKSLNKVLAWHEVFRSTFPSGHQKPLVAIMATMEYPLTFTDLSMHSAEIRYAEASKIISKDAQSHIDIENGPLLRVRLIQLAADEHILILVTHHIIADNRSLHLLWRDLYAYYTASAEHISPSGRELLFQFADYAAWQNNLLDTQREHYTAYWRKHMDGAEPMFGQFPPMGGGPADIHLFSLPVDISESIRIFSYKNRTTPFLILLASLKILLHHYTKSKDITVGCSIANRHIKGTEDLVGFFANTLLLRSRLSQNIPAQQLLQNTYSLFNQANKYRDLPIEKLLQLLNQDHVEVLFNFIPLNQKNNTYAESELNIIPMKINQTNIYSHPCLFLIISERSDGIKGELIYRTDILQAFPVKYFIDEYIEIIYQFLGHSGHNVLHLS